MDTMEFMRGDRVQHTFAIPAESWTSGGRLFFAAKQAIDDDNTDALALIQGTWDDNSVTDVTINGIAYKEYNCDFPGSATNAVESDGAESLELLGEFQFVPAGGIDPVTFPAPGDPRIPTILYFDVKRKTVV